MIININTETCVTLSASILLMLRGLYLSVQDKIRNIERIQFGRVKIKFKIDKQ